MSEYPKRILGKRAKNPNIIFYLIEFETPTHKVRTQWIEMYKLGNYLDLIEQYEARNNQNYYMELLKEIIEDDDQYEQIRELDSLKTTEDQICRQTTTDFMIPQRENQEFVYHLKKENNQQVELNKELKNITKSFQKGGSRVAFTEEQIVKIITYAKDELDNNKYIFLVEWKPRESGHFIRPSWVGQEKMMQYAPQYLERFANEKGFKLN
ncbi:unnamed protein product [Paramecium pentaurelia]|uniref:Chromo domain-containing protein n=1 Tax=Paramecium pentaurelia TaxID=43138 RepID=A0A8S1WLT9_9CILI|nr:unnamed protein product [Paramecium pentaurelia]